MRTVNTRQARSLKPSCLSERPDDCTPRPAALRAWDPAELVKQMWSVVQQQHYRKLVRKATLGPTLDLLNQNVWLNRMPRQCVCAAVWKHRPESHLVQHTSFYRWGSEAPRKAEWRVSRSWPGPGTFWPRCSAPSCSFRHIPPKVTRLCIYKYVASTASWEHWMYLFSTEAFILAAFWIHLEDAGNRDLENHLTVVDLLTTRCQRDKTTPRWCAEPHTTLPGGNPDGIVLHISGPGMHFRSPATNHPSPLFPSLNVPKSWLTHGSALDFN